MTKDDQVLQEIERILSNPNSWRSTQLTVIRETLQTVINQVKSQK